MTSTELSQPCPVCSKTGRPLQSHGVSPSRTTLFKRWTAALTGVAALVWFLIRVIPKPSRAMYPCQRAAFPIAAAFVAYLLGMSGAAVALRRARRYLGESRYVVASLCLMAVLACIVLAGDSNPSTASAAYAPLDPPNTPVGTGKGIFPGRVSWVWDANATKGETTWTDTGSTETTKFYWDDAHTSQTVVDTLVSKNLQWLTDEDTDSGAWDALFHYYNQTHGRGDVGYTAGEKVYIKTNHVDQRRHVWNYNRADIAPAMELSVLRQLVNQAGVPQNMITIGDASRFFAGKSYGKCAPEFPNVHYGETTFYRYQPADPPGGTEGRELLTSTPLAVIHYSGVDDHDPAHPGESVPIPDGHIPVICQQATYIINLGVMKGHGDNGVTLSGKNWYGCFGEPPGGYIGGGAQHHLLIDTTTEPNHYRLQVDLMGYKDLGGKTMLYILDGLWGFQFHGSSSAKPVKWNYPPFGSIATPDYPSSVLMSQDTVAIDSVGLDFLRTQFADNMGGQHLDGPADDYLHEAAQADSAPSGTVYDPENDGTPFESLGVHEHWTDSTVKTYTRNLSASGLGIELINYDLGLTPGPEDTPTPATPPPGTGVAHWELYR